MLRSKLMRQTRTTATLDHEKMKRHEGEKERTTDRGKTDVIVADESRDVVDGARISSA